MEEKQKWGPVEWVLMIVLVVVILAVIAALLGDKAIVLINNIGEALRSIFVH